MPDPLSPERRSAQMRTVRGQDTRPELIVRRLAHRLGYRFRLHRRDLPGSPDLAFPSRRKVVFVHGCFWHGHSCKRGARMPASNADYWRAKLARNVERDAAALERLATLGWRALVIWECELKDEGDLALRLRGFLDDGQPSSSAASFATDAAPPSAS